MNFSKDIFSEMNIPPFSFEDAFFDEKYFESNSSLPNLKEKSEKNEQKDSVLVNTIKMALNTVTSLNYNEIDNKETNSFSHFNAIANIKNEIDLNENMNVNTDNIPKWFASVDPKIHVSADKSYEITKNEDRLTMSDSRPDYEKTVRLIKEITNSGNSPEYCVEQIRIILDQIAKPNCPFETVFQNSREEKSSKYTIQRLSSSSETSHPCSSNNFFDINFNERMSTLQQRNLPLGGRISTTSPTNELDLVSSMDIVTTKSESNDLINENTDVCSHIQSYNYATATHVPQQSLQSREMTEDCSIETSRKKKISNRDSSSKELDPDCPMGRKISASSSSKNITGKTLESCCSCKYYAFPCYLHKKPKPSMSFPHRNHSKFPNRKTEYMKKLKKVFQCNFCKLLLINFTKAVRHPCIIERKYFKCNVCSFRYARSDTLLRHMKSHALSYRTKRQQEENKKHFSSVTIKQIFDKTVYEAHKEIHKEFMDVIQT